MQDVANALEQTLDLPSILPHGARVDPTTDGFLLWLPSSMSSCQYPYFKHKFPTALVNRFLDKPLCCKSCMIGSESNVGSLLCCAMRALSWTST